jgi:hypothetical protein
MFSYRKTKLIINFFFVQEGLKKWGGWVLNPTPYMRKPKPSHCASGVFVKPNLF